MKLTQPAIMARAHNSRRRPTRIALAATAAVLLLSTACSGDNAGQGNTSPSTLTIGISYPPTPNLDPGQTGGSNLWYLVLGYDPLIHQAPDGKLQPRLATSWRYTDTENKVFELRLRSGVTFSDGSPLTAEVVKANLDRYRNSPELPTAAQLADVHTVEAVDPLTVRVTLSQPNPMLPNLFSEWQGYIVSKAGLRSPKKLATRMFGAGPYVLDSAQTIAGDHYTYTPNTHYWNKRAVHWDKVVIKVLPNPNTAIRALKAGQVDVVAGSPATDSAAKSAGLSVAAAPQVWVGLALADRAGKVLPPLGDVRVRQALNYAINRDEIATGLVATYGGPTPTEQIVLPGQDGDDGKNFYTYDPAKARQLLREAGYPDGFTLPVVSWAQATPLLEVMANDLKAVGVRLDITDRGSNSNKYLQDMTSGKFPAYGITFGALPVHQMGPLLFLKDATPFNPFHSSDAEIESLYTRAAAAGPAERERLDQELVARIVEQGWFVPALFQPASTYSRKGIAGVQAQPARPIPNPVEWAPAG